MLATASDSHLAIIVSVTFGKGAKPAVSTNSEWNQNGEMVQLTVFQQISSGFLLINEACVKKKT